MNVLGRTQCRKKISWNQLITQRNRKRERQYGNIIETMKRERERDCTVYTHTQLEEAFNNI